ncbi:hypothetical protein BDP27DRAFT_1447639 [Rhodocollybia butyracea]|uniref:Uncharacterized protein n=1 Tax=Rhodocollybia butyracea TaxID=206335 RepID=A0A9P5U722_9AGAR|nr:hypothetical protein BDP27DRAFT_1447639 [Rhodocollybia butyracea]
MRFMLHITFHFVGSGILFQLIGHTDRWNYLRKCAEHHNDAYRWDRVRWMNSMGGFDKATAAQWNYRAKLVGRSRFFSGLFPPFKRNGRIVIFPPITPPDIIMHQGASYDPDEDRDRAAGFFFLPFFSSDDSDDEDEDHSHNICHSYSQASNPPPPYSRSPATCNRVHSNCPTCSC